MAITMADSFIRKACDRCHSQKLSCKRVGDEPCERCIRLQTECKSSPSLRYKKQHQQQQQQLQEQQQQQIGQLAQQQVRGQQPPPPPPPPSQKTTSHQNKQQSLPESHLAGLAAVTGRRSPKRRRTVSDLQLIQPGQTESSGHTASKSADQATEEPTVPSICVESALEPGNFDFSQFEQLGFFSPPTQPQLVTGPIPVVIDGFQTIASSFTDPWDLQIRQQHPEGFQQPVVSFPSTRSDHYQVPATTVRSRTTARGLNQSDKRRRPRQRNRPRQIALRHVVHAPAADVDAAPPGHWMAQLSEINTRLLELAAVLPQQQITTACHRQALGRQADEAVFSQGFPIDEMFKLTRRVADILDRLSTRATAGDATRAVNRMDNSDPGNSMFVISTYVRLLDMYQKVFSLVRMELSQADAGAAFRFWRLPDVQVGSFAVDPSPSLQMSLTIQLAEEFLARLRAATAALDPALSNGNCHITVTDDGTNGKSMFSDVVDVSFRAVKTKEESLGKHLAELRDEIEAYLDE